MEESEINVGGRKVRILELAQDGHHVLDFLLHSLFIDVVEQRLINLYGVDFAAKRHRLCERHGEDPGAGTDVGNHVPLVELEFSQYFFNLEACDPFGPIQALDPFLGGPGSELPGRRLSQADGEHQSRQAGYALPVSTHDCSTGYTSLDITTN